jgi:hypothetical protein
MPSPLQMVKGCIYVAEFSKQGSFHSGSSIRMIVFEKKYKVPVEALK